MKIRTTNTIASTLLCVVAATLITGCEKKNAGGAAAAPGLEETKAIAEEGFIYGLPIVMNYAVMNEYAVDKGGPQFKAPFNQIKNEYRVYTYEDTAVITPNSDTPYSLLWLDLRAEPIVLSVPAVDKKRYYAVMLCDGNTYNFGYIGSRATGSAPGDYLVVGPDWKGETPPGIKKVFSSTTPFTAAAYRTQLFNAGDMPNVEKVQAGYKVQPLSAFLKQSPPTPRRRSISSRPPPRGSRRTSLSIWTLPSSSSRRTRIAKRSAPNSPVSVSARARPSTLRISRRNIGPQLCSA